MALVSSIQRNSVSRGLFSVRQIWPFSMNASSRISGIFHKVLSWHLLGFLIYNKHRRYLVEVRWSNGLWWNAQQLMFFKVTGQNGCMYSDSRWCTNVQLAHLREYIWNTYWLYNIEIVCFMYMAFILYMMDLWFVYVCLCVWNFPCKSAYGGFAWGCVFMILCILWMGQHLFAVFIQTPCCIYCYTWFLRLTSSQLALCFSKCGMIEVC